MKGKEIERKWLFNGFPENIQPIDEFKQVQTYLQFNPEVRIRVQMHWDDNTEYFKYLLETKSDGDLTRNETKKSLTKVEYYAIRNLVEGHILKDCKDYQLGRYTLTLAQVDNSDFFYGEIEFETEDEANAFIVPDWFGGETTYDRDYKMRNYYRRKYGVEY